MLERYIRPARGADNEGGSGAGAGAPPVVTPPVVTPPVVTPAVVEPKSVLFASENEPPKEGDKPAPVDPAGDKPAAVEWKEFEPDATKTDEENAAAKAEHDKTKPAEPDALDVVPADGKYVLTMPEGVTVDQELLDALGPKFAAKKMTPREAQGFADEFIKVQTAREEARAAGWVKTVEGWAETASKDPEIGGVKWDGTVRDGKRAIAALGTPALREYLEASGGGNHPEFIRFAAKVGAMIKEDIPAAGGAGGSGRPVEAAHRLFPDDAPKG
jgi:hypothetical protein